MLKWLWFPAHSAPWTTFRFVDYFICPFSILPPQSQLPSDSPDIITILTHFFPMHPFFTPWKHQPSGHPILWRHRFFVGFTLRYRPIAYWDWGDIVIWYLFPVSSKLPPRKLPPGWFPPDNSHPENFHPKNSYPHNSHPGKLPSGKIFIQPIATPDNCHPAKLIKFNNI